MFCIHTVLHHYAKDDFLVERQLSSHVRRKDPSLPKKWEMRVVRFKTQAGKIIELATNLPNEDYSATDIIALYHKCWQIELGYRELKSTMMNNALTLRSKKVEPVYQELYGLFLAYNLVRYEIASTAEVVDVRPNRISFKAAIVVVFLHYHGMGLQLTAYVPYRHE
jgi:IS4 transposase